MVDVGYIIDITFRGRILRCTIDDAWREHMRLYHREYYHRNKERRKVQKREYYRRWRASKTVEELVVIDKRKNELYKQRKKERESGNVVKK